MRRAHPGAPIRVASQTTTTMASRTAIALLLLAASASAADWSLRLLPKGAGNNAGECVLQYTRPVPVVVDSVDSVTEEVVSIPAAPQTIATGGINISHGFLMGWW